ncbi:MAG: ABC transporter permease, partial [Acidobacteriota bacterium]
MRFWRRSIPVPAAVARQIDEELDEHLRRRTEDLMGEGMPEPAARRQAMAEFGDLDEARRELGAIDARIAARRGGLGGGGGGRGRVLASAASWIDDVRLSWRRLRRHPGSALIVLGMLAAAIGMSAAMFTVVDALFLRPVPFVHPETLATVEMPAIDGPSTGVNLPLPVVNAWESSGTFAAVSGALSVGGILEGNAGPVRYSADVVTPGVFEMLGVRPLLGRTFVDGDGRAGSEETAILSAKVWRTEFSSDPSILGRLIDIDGTPTRVVGVMPAEFRFPHPSTEIWLPIDVATPRERYRELIGLWVYARLPAGVPIADVLQRAESVAQDADPWAQGRRITTRPLTQALDEYTTRATTAVTAGVALVFLVLCANSGNLLLGRLTSRRRELATASALGASRMRLLRQAMIEHGMLGVAASLAGIALGAGLLAWARASLPDMFLLRSSLNPVDLDARAVLATSLAGLAGTMIAGLLPAWLATRPRTAAHLRTLVDRTDTGSRSARLLARGLLVVEIAFAVTLLVGASMLLQSLVNLTRADLGLDAENVIVVDISLPDYVEAFGDPDANLALARSLVAEVGALPGVSASAISRGTPPSAQTWRSGEFLADGSGEPVSFDRMPFYSVTPAFFEVYGISIIEGRALRESDADDAVVVGERLARALWPDGAAVGRRFGQERVSFAVVGVAREIRSLGSADPRDDALEVYRLYHPNGRLLSFFGVTISLRCATGCPSAAAVRQRVHATDPRLLINRVERVSDAYAELLARPRAAATLTTSFAAIALLTFAGGLFSALHYAVGRRLPELGIRAALGASAAGLGRSVLREGLLVAV